MGDAAQYVAGTVPVAVSHHPDRANGVPEGFIREFVSHAHRHRHEVRLVAHAFGREHHADHAQQAPYRFGVVFPAQFYQDGLAQIAQRALCIQDHAFVMHGGSPRRRRCSCP